MVDRNRLYAVTDETWVFFNPAHPKANNKAWICRGESRPTVVRDTAMTTKKTLMSIVFTINKKFHLQATSPKETIDASYFINFLHRAGEKWRTLRSDPTRLDEILLQYDNARPHVARDTTAFLKRRNVNCLWQAPYSPDFNLCDRWLFKVLKSELRKKQYVDADEVLADSLQFLKSIPENQYQHQLERLLDHCQLVIERGGDYVTE